MGESLPYQYGFRFFAGRRGCFSKSHKSVEKIFSGGRVALSEIHRSENPLHITHAHLPLFTIGKYRTAIFQVEQRHKISRIKKQSNNYQKKKFQTWKTFPEFAVYKINCDWLEIPSFIQSNKV